MRPLTAALVAATLAACTPEPPAEPVPIECTMHTDPELVLGIQGLVFFTVRVESRDLPERSTAQYEVRVDDEVPLKAKIGGVPGTTATEEGAITDDIWVVLGGDIGDRIGQTAHLSLVLVGDGRICEAAAEVLLVDDDHCLHSFDGPICPD